MIAYQVTLMRQLSITQWYHFAYMVIAIAMLGFGFSGTFLALFKRWLSATDPQKQLYVISIIIMMSGISMPLCAELSTLEPIRFDSYELFVDRAVPLKLVITCLLLMVPFFFTALALGLSFYRFPKDIGKLYFANLSGSGLGAIAVLFLLSQLPVRPIIYSLALIAWISGFLLLPFNKRFVINKGALFSYCIAFITFTTIFWLPSRSVNSPYKSIETVLQLPDSKKVYSKNSIYGLIEAVRAPSLRYAPGISMIYTDTIPRVEALFNNGNWQGTIPLEPAYAKRALRYTTPFIPFELAGKDRALILGDGTGNRSLLAHEVRYIGITGVESMRPVTERYQAIVGIVNNEQHAVFTRHFLNKTKNSYNLISFPTCGVPGGGSGLNAIQENYLYTRETFKEAAERLTADGVIEASSYIDYPYRVPLRLLSTMFEGIKGEIPENTDPEDYLLAVRSWNMISYFFKKNGFSPQELTFVRQECEQKGFDPLIFPDLTVEERSYNNELEDESLFRATDAILNGRLKEFQKNYPFKIEAVTDNQPYFAQFLKIENLRALLSTFGFQGTGFLELGYLILLITILLLIFLAFLMILLPLIWKRSAEKLPLWVGIYFPAIGIGFMFTEIVLIQRFILFLEDPVISVSVVIGSLLAASGAGSYFSETVSSFDRTGYGVFLILVLILCVYPWLLSTGFEALHMLNSWQRYAVSAVLISLPGFCMGMMFPKGMKQLTGSSVNHIPWAWGLNNYFSVIASSVAVLLSINTGLTTVFYLGAVCYLLAAFAINHLQKTSR
ncbi:hypothetical protein [Robertkochia aurantiaca]|uniref:hypothetical protein n=1 Tax=Robertkochia aurantiaca TaxID=2873700 RepID=UPI001CCDA3B8|nr:hypothetical protein [Robertkochia sp. 3YJGBD-33]